MEHEQESKASAEDLQKKNLALTEKIQEYKRLEEDLMAERVYEKARKRLVTLITFGGIALTIIGILGFKSIIDYTKNLITDKIESVSEEQINKIVREEGERRVLDIVKEQQSKVEAFLIATARQQISQITMASSPVRGEGKSTFPADYGQRALDLTSSMLPVRYQGLEGSTVGFAVAAAMEYQINKKLDEEVTISPRHLYYYSRLEAGYPLRSDTGAFVRDAIKVLRTKGAVSEDSWPYKAGEFGSEPPEGIKIAKSYKISESYQVRDLEEIKIALQEHGPVVAGISIFEKSLNDKEVKETGVIPDPNSSERAVGAAAICIVGYDDDTELVKFKNSWGVQWGDDGYGYISYNYVEKFLTDAWIFTL